jgi:hypothetical protein
VNEAFISLCQQNREEIMSHRFRSVGIEDVEVDNIDSELQDELVDLYAYTVRSIAPTLVREARFHTDDFATAKQRNCLGFELVLTRKVVNGTTFWLGSFVRGDQTLDVTGSLE